MGMTMRKIAELSGVSIGTVDRVINRRGKVKPEVEARIRMIIDEVGYTPNLTAKSLVLKRQSPKIGVVFHLKESVFHDEVMRGVAQAQNEMRDFGVNILLRASRDFSADDQLSLIDDLLREDAKAVVITPVNDARVGERIDELAGRNYPVFCLISDIATARPHPFIGIDAHKSGKVAAGLFNLLSGGRPQTVAVVTPLLKVLGNTQRIQGLADTLAVRYPHIKLENPCEIDTDNVSVYKAVEKYLKSRPEISQLWYATSIGDGGITAMRDLGLLGTIGLVGLDTCDFVTKGLEEGYMAASISQQPYRQGYQAMRTVFNTILESAYRSELREEIDCKILIRENLAPPTSLSPQNRNTQTPRR